MSFSWKIHIESRRFFPQKEDVVIFGQKSSDVDVVVDGAKKIETKSHQRWSNQDRGLLYIMPTDRAHSLCPSKLMNWSRIVCAQTVGDFFHLAAFQRCEKYRPVSAFTFTAKKEIVISLTLSFFLSFFSSSFSGSLFVFSLILSLSLSWCSLYHSLYYSLSCFIVFLSLPLSFYLNFHRLSFFPYGLIFQFFLLFSFYLSFSFFYCLETVSKI